MELISFRGFNFENNGFFTGLPYGVPFMTLQPNLLQRAGTTPVFGPGTVTERTIVAQIGARVEAGFFDSYEEAWDTLLQRMKPTENRVGELRAARLDGTIVSINAVMVIPMGAINTEVNVINVSFVAVDSYWKAETETLESKAFSQAEDLALSVPITGNVAQAPVIRIKPTAQRASGTATAGFKRRRAIRITNGLTRSLVNFPYRLDLGDTATIVTATLMQADGDDVRVVYQGKEIPRTLDDMNTASTGAWVIIPNLAPGATMDFDILFGNSAATAPDTLASLGVLSKPPIDLATSTNLVWKYNVSEIAANAGLGGWPLSSGTTIPIVSTDAPGAWRFATIVNSSPDSTWQERYTSYVDSGTKYIAKLYARRARAAVIQAAANYVDADGVSLFHPGNISSVKASIKWRNDYAKGVTGAPIARLGIYASDTGDDWRTVNEWSTVQADTEATVASADYAVSPSAPFVAFATKPYVGAKIPSTVQASKLASIRWHDTLEVTVGGAGITQSTVQADEEIYELALSARVGGDTDEDGPYSVLRIGGAADRRLVARLNEVLKIETQERRASVWNTAETTKMFDVPIYAVDSREKLALDGAEIAAQRWLPMASYANPLANADFAVNASDWSRAATGAGVTAAALSRVAGPPNYMLSQITASTGASGIAALQDRNDEYLDLPANRVAHVGADVYTSIATLVPRLTIWFYDSALSAVGSADMESLYTPPAATWIRRVHQVTAPATAKYYRVGVTVWTTAANVTGQVRSTKYRPDGNELIVRDAALGTLAVSVGWIAQYL